MSKYEIVAAVGSGEFYGTRSGDWATDPIGSDNQYESIEAAEGGIRALRDLGGDWLHGTYAVREVGARYPEIGTIDSPEDDHAHLGIVGRRTR